MEGQQVSMFSEGESPLHAGKVGFCTGMFATWIAKEAGRVKPTKEDIKRARRGAEAAVRAIG